MNLTHGGEVSALHIRLPRPHHDDVPVADAAVRGPQFLVVEDEPIEARAMVRRLSRYGDVAVATTAAEAETLLAEERFSGALIDWKLPDGDGLELVASLRERFPRLTVALLTAHVDRDCINRVHVLGAEYVAKPPTRANIHAFVDRALRPRASAADIEEIAALWARRYALSAAEAELLRLSLSGVPRTHLASRTGLTENTIKSYVKRVLDKCNAPSMAVLVGRILREEVVRT